MTNTFLALCLASTVIVRGNINSTVASITVDVDWGTTNTSAATVASAARTLTVPSGSSGVVRLNSTANNTDKYKLAGGSFTTFTDGTLITAADTNTLQLEITSAVSGDTETITVYDNVTGALIGTAVLHRP